MGGQQRSLGEWAVLGLLAEEAAHPFALARSLGRTRSPGRVLTVPRPLVYRAVDRLLEAGLIERDRIEPGEAGPERTVYRIHERGRAALDNWLREPVPHIRDIRLAFLLKVELLRRSGSSVGELARAQQAALASTLDGLARLPDDPDVAELWRHHNAAATAAFLEALAAGR